VVAFHQDSTGLKELSPPLMFIRLKKAEPIAEGSVVDFRMWLGPIPIDWIAVHSDVTENGFTDTQVSGPFTSWTHRHTFHLLDSRMAEVVDEIQAKPGRGLYWGLVSRLMWLGLPVLFAYRARVLKRKLEVQGE
jgi:ligand-binding SRPBCC domain-containing protein